MYCAELKKIVEVFHLENILPEINLEGLCVNPPDGAYLGAYVVWFSTGLSGSMMLLPYCESYAICGVMS